MQIFAADQMIAVQIMEGFRHLSKPGVRVDQHCLRRLEGLARQQPPAEALRMNAHHHAHRVMLRQLRLRQKIAGVDKIHRIHFTDVLRGFRSHQSQEGITLMAGFSAHRGHTLISTRQLLPFDMALPRPGAVQRDLLKRFVIHIQAGAQHALQIDFFL